MAMVYHDLRSPLSNIISSLEMLNMLMPPTDNENLHSILTIAMRSSDRMQRLIATLLDIYRLEAGQPITNRQRVEVFPLVYEAIDAVQPVVENKGQVIKMEVEKDLPALWIDCGHDPPRDHQPARQRHQVHPLQRRNRPVRAAAPGRWWNFRSATTVRASRPINST